MLYTRFVWWWYFLPEETRKVAELWRSPLSISQKAKRTIFLMQWDAFTQVPFTNPWTCPFSAPFSIPITNYVMSFSVPFSFSSFSAGFFVLWLRPSTSSSTPLGIKAWISLFLTSQGKISLIQGQTCQNCSSFLTRVLSRIQWLSQAPRVDPGSLISYDTELFLYPHFPYSSLYLLAPLTKSSKQRCVERFTF